LHKLSPTKKNRAQPKGAKKKEFPRSTACHQLRFTLQLRLNTLGFHVLDHYFLDGALAFFRGMKFFFSPLGYARFFLVGDSLCKNFFKSNTGHG